MKFLSLPSLLLFLLILGLLVVEERLHPVFDVDLGVNTARLSLLDLAEWSLPLALGIWFVSVAVIKGIGALFARRKKE